MKKKLMLSVIFAAILSACGGGNETIATTESVTPSDGRTKALYVTTAPLATSIRVLMYHEIVPDNTGLTPDDMVTTVSTFNAHMKWLRDHGYMTITAGQLGEWMANPGKINLPDGKTPIVITFDDGWTSQRNALPALNIGRFKATFNIIGEAPGYWGSSFMTWAQVRDLRAKGHEIGNHTETHPEPPEWGTSLAWTPEIYDFEIRKSREWIAYNLKVPESAIKTLAWPNGYFNPDMTAMAVSTGYSSAQSIDDGWCYEANHSLEGTPLCNWATGNNVNQDPMKMKRIFIDGRCSVYEFGVEVTRGWAGACTGATGPATLEVNTEGRATILAANGNGNGKAHGNGNENKHVNLKRPFDPIRDSVDPKNDGEDRGHGDDRSKEVFGKKK